MRSLTDILVSIPAILIALAVHEFAHAWVADRQGDPTPRAMGRLTLNPLAHLDPIGTLMLLFFRFGWAKPVGVNPFYFHDRRRGMLRVALAGVTANVILAFLSVWALVQFSPFPIPWLDEILSSLFYINIFLAVFNILPIPPLDGSRVVRALARPGSRAWEIAGQLEQYGPVILLLLVVSRMLGSILVPLATSLAGLLYLLARTLSI